MPKTFTKSIDIIEAAQSYYLLSKDHAQTGSKPVFIGNRIQLEFALEYVPTDMIIATSGNDRTCIILVDYPLDVIFQLKQKSETRIVEIKAKN